MNWFLLTELASTFAFLIPVLIILIFRLFANNSILAVRVYYLLAFVYNLMTAGLLPVSAALKNGAGLFNNFSDTPLVLLFVVLFASSAKVSRQIKWIAVGYIVYELLIILIFRYDTQEKKRM